MMNFDELRAGDVLHWPRGSADALYYVVLYREAGRAQLAVLGENADGDLIATDHLALVSGDDLAGAHYVGLLLELRP